MPDGILNYSRSRSAAGRPWALFAIRSSCRANLSSFSLCLLLLLAVSSRKKLSAASYNFASAATRGLLPRSKEASTQKKLDAVWGVVQQIVEVCAFSGSLAFEGSFFLYLSAAPQFLDGAFHLPGILRGVEL